MTGRNAGRLRSNAIAATTVTLCGALLSGCAADQQACKMAFATRIPLTVDGQRFRLPIGINGHALSLTLDTGSDVTVITPAAAKRADILPAALPGAYMEGIGGTQDTSTGAIKTLAFGRLRGHEMPIYVAKIGPDHNSGTEDGLLGMDAMVPFDIDIDPITNDLTLYRPTEGCVTPSAVMSGPLYVLPLLTQPDSTGAYIDVAVNGHVLRAQLDSGATQTVITADSALKAGLEPSRRLSESQSYATGIGPHPVHTVDYILGAITFGDFEIDHMRIDVINTPRTSLHTDMLLGGDFFHRFHVWISHSSHTVILQYPPSASPPLTDEQKRAQANAG